MTYLSRIGRETGAGADVAAQRVTTPTVVEAAAELAQMTEDAKSNGAQFARFFGAPAHRSPVQDRLQAQRAAYLRSIVAESDSNVAQ